MLRLLPTSSVAVAIGFLEACATVSRLHSRSHAHVGQLYKGTCPKRRLSLRIELRQCEGRSVLGWVLFWCTLFCRLAEPGWKLRRRCLRIGCKAQSVRTVVDFTALSIAVCMHFCCTLFAFSLQFRCSFVDDSSTQAENKQKNCIRVEN